MKEYTIENFESEVLNSTGLAVIDFYANDCAPCAAMAPIFEEIAEEMASEAKFGKVNTSDNVKLAISQRIMMLPTIVLYKDGKKTANIHGKLATKEGIIEMIRSNA